MEPKSLCNMDLVLTYLMWYAKVSLSLYAVRSLNTASEVSYGPGPRDIGSAREFSQSPRLDRPIVRCPFCKEDQDRVVDSRSSDGGRMVRRRRQCLACERRFTTYERIEESLRLTVVKKDNSRVPYNREQIISGVQKSCYKRPVSVEQIEQLAEEVEEDIFRRHGREIDSRHIGQLVMGLLRRLDKIAYVRYASVYHEFKDLGQFIHEVNDVMSTPDDNGAQGRLFGEDT